MFKNTTVKQKIYVLAFLGVCISSFIAIESIVSIREVGQKLKQISLEDIPLTNKVTEITIHQLEQAIRLERSIKYAEIMAHDPKAVKGFKKAVKEFKKYAHKVDSEIVEAEEMVAHILEIESDPVIVEEFEHVNKILHDIEGEHAVFDKHAYEVFDLLDAGQLAKAEVLAYKIEDEVQALDLHLEELLLELETFTAAAAAEALKIEKKAERLIMLSSIVFVALFIILSYLIARSIVKSMLAVQGYAEKLSLGDLQAETPVHYFNDEILAVISALDTLKGAAQEAESLREKQARQEEENELAKRRAMMGLADSFETSVADAITSLSEASEQLQRTSSNMKSVADTTTECSTSVARSASESSQNVGTVASAMEEMSASSSEIASQITLVKNKSNQAAESARSASGTVNNLNELVANIGEVVYAIQDIAEQTNLLALNATIEAARAGEAGKGFAVVADEVKKLATETSVKTQEINERITEIQEATHASVESMDTIIGNITDIDGSVTSVSAAVEEQNVTTNEIVRSVSDASQGTQEVSAVIVDVQQGLAEVGRAAGGVLSASETATSLSSDLKKSVDDFLSGVRRDNKC